MQLNEMLRGADPNAVTADVTRKAIESVVDEELLVQEAEAQKFDRDPGTVAAIEHARRQILAQTYAARRILPRVPVQQSEEQKYYRDNPALFERRRIYQLTVYTVKSADATDVVKKQLNDTVGVDAPRSVLDKHGIRYQVQQISTAAEDLPIDKLTQFANAKPGDVLIADKPPGQILLISMVGSEEKPISFESARQMITAYLTKSRNAKALEEHLKSQRAIAKIDYVGDFAKAANK
jgi:EpsD family peptidyl-prolyl cis-trans isomerase